MSYDQSIKTFKKGPKAKLYMKDLDIRINKKVFIPTGTSEILIEAAKKIIKPKKKILDLGCGSGIVGISIAKYLKRNTKIYFSDISKHACKNTEFNCLKLKIKYEVKKWFNFRSLERSQI